MLPPVSCSFCGGENQPQARFCRLCGQALPADQGRSATGRLLPNVLLKQRYRIGELAGQGGFGAVYRAEDTQLGNRLVAIKELGQSGLNPQEQNEAALASKQEAVILARLHHPNLPGIIEHFEEDQRWYLVMNFVEGETLEAYLARQPEGRLALNEAIDVGIQLCTVLDYLHNQQPPIVFRDLKPANVMRTPRGHLYLIDFGIARIFKPGKAKDTTAYGSTGYAPPEQHSATTTPCSDIYSLGATLHQLISGHDPASSPFRFPPLQSLVPAVPAGLATWITQMLDMDDSKRPANMALVKQALQPLQASLAAAPSPGSSAPVSPSSSRPRLRRRPPEPAGTLVMHHSGHTQAVQALAWSPDGKRIASASGDGVVMVWSMDRRRRTFVRRDSRAACVVAWSPDGQKLASVAGRSVEIWDAENGRGQLFYAVSSAVLTGAWAPDGSRIAFGLENGEIQIWPADGSVRPFTYRGHTASFLDVLFKVDV